MPVARRPSPVARRPSPVARRPSPVARVDVLYVTELVGLTVIWLGYRTIVDDRVPSIYRAQRKLESV